MISERWFRHFVTLSSVLMHYSTLVVTIFLKKWFLKSGKIMTRGYQFLISKTMLGLYRKKFYFSRTRMKHSKTADKV